MDDVEEVVDDVDEYLLRSLVSTSLLEYVNVIEPADIMVDDR